MTPIKVRGKKRTGSPHEPFNKSLSPNSQHHVKRRLHPFSDFKLPSKTYSRITSPHIPTSIISQYRQYTSLLEQLPAELLEVIFFFCLNVNLPQASLIIGHKLASCHVKRQLVLRVLCSNSTTDASHALSDVFPSPRDHADAQSAILRLKWLTLPFLRELIPDFIVQTLVRELAERKLQWMGHGPTVSKETEPLIREYIKNNHHRTKQRAGYSRLNLAYLRNHGLGISAYWELKWPTNGMIPSDISADDDYLNGLVVPWPRDEHEGHVYVGIGLREGLVTMWQPSLDDLDEIERERIDGGLSRGYQVPFKFKQWRITDCLDGCRIPEKLLHGPWTDEKCEFLEILIRGNASVDWVETTSGEVAKEGLLQAFRERNAWAITLLLGSSHPPSNHFTKYYANDEDFASGHLSTSTFREVVPRKGVCIPPTAEHLRVAVFEEGGDADVVGAILNAPDLKIEPESGEIYEWALKHEIRYSQLPSWMRWD